MERVIRIKRIVEIYIGSVRFGGKPFEYYSQIQMFSACDAYIRNAYYCAVFISPFAEPDYNFGSHSMKFDGISPCISVELALNLSAEILWDKFVDITKAVRESITTLSST